MWSVGWTVAAKVGVETSNSEGEDLCDEPFAILVKRLSITDTHARQELTRQFGAAIKEVMSTEETFEPLWNRLGGLSDPEGAVQTLLFEGVADTYGARRRARARPTAARQAAAAEGDSGGGGGPRPAAATVSGVCDMYAFACGFTCEFTRENSCNLPNPSHQEPPGPAEGDSGGGGGPRPAAATVSGVCDMYAFACGFTCEFTRENSCNLPNPSHQEPPGPAEGDSGGGGGPRPAAATVSGDVRYVRICMWFYV
jgi:hypothetical protein